MVSISSYFHELPAFTLTSLIDIFLVAVLIYQFIIMIRGRRAAHIIVGVVILGLIYVAASIFQLEVLRTILATLAPYTAFGLIVVFQSDIRRMLARIGRRRFLGFSGLERREMADEIILALTQLSQQQTGALIVVEQNIGLRTFVESGVTLDAVLSRDLLLAIFMPKGALHDGAVIVYGRRIIAAGCFLPLTTNPALSTKLGTRHRAAIGVTEESDCLALVVSEETGLISVAFGGEIEVDVPLDRVAQILTSRSSDRMLFGPRRASKGVPAPPETVARR